MFYNSFNYGEVYFSKNTNAKRKKLKVSISVISKGFHSVIVRWMNILIQPKYISIFILLYKIVSK